MRVDALIWLKQDVSHYIDVCFEHCESEEEKAVNDDSQKFVNELLEDGAVKVEIEEPRDECAIYLYITVPELMPKSLFEWLGKWRPDEFHEEEKNTYYVFWDLH